MAILVDKQYIRVIPSSDFEYEVTTIEQRKINKKYYDKLYIFLSKMEESIRDPFIKVSVMAYRKNKTEEEIVEWLENNQIAKDYKFAKGIQKDLNTIMENTLYGIEGKIDNLDYLKEKGFDENFLKVRVGDIHKLDISMNMNVKQKYEYLKCKFPGCKDC